MRRSSRCWCSAVLHSVTVTVWASLCFGVCRKPSPHAACWNGTRLAAAQHSCQHMVVQKLTRLIASPACWWQSSLQRRCGCSSTLHVHLRCMRAACLPGISWMPLYLLSEQLHRRLRVQTRLPCTTKPLCCSWMPLQKRTKHSCSAHTMFSITPSHVLLATTPTSHQKHDRLQIHTNSTLLCTRSHRLASTDKLLSTAVLPCCHKGSPLNSAMSCNCWQVSQFSHGLLSVLELC